MTIVVGIDGSACSERAMMWAIGEARRRQAPLQLVHAWTLALGGHVEMARSLTLLADAARSLTDRYVASVRAAAPDVQVDGSTVESAPAHALADAAAGAELLVVGSHGRGAIGRALVGSVADACLRLAEIPVVVIRPDAKEVEGGPVVVGVDGSPTSAAAVAVAMREAELRAATLAVVHAWHIPITVVDYAAVGALGDEDWERNGRTVLASAVANISGAAKVEPRLVRGPAASVLVDAAAGASLLVVGTRGLSGLGATLLGSVSRRVVHTATCPLIVVPDGAVGLR